MQLDLIEKDVLKLMLLELNSLKETHHKTIKSLYAKIHDLEKRVPKKGTFVREDVNQLRFL